jgi:hypothetical protein
LTAGASGYAGPQGFQSYAGPQGFQGYAGPQGFQGSGNAEVLSTLMRIERKVDVSLRTSFGLALTAFDAYVNMTQTSAGNNKPRQEEIRRNYYDHCGITKDPNDKGKSPAICVLTGRTGDGNKKTLKLAHLVPASAPASILETLKLSNDENGIWSLRNVLLLCWNIEYYFDRKKLSFVSNPLYENTYTLKLWDDAVGDELIYPGAEDIEVGDRFIKFYVGRPLNLLMPNGVTLVPFKRCLSYQMFVSFAATKLPTADAPQDFVSDIDGWLAKRDDLMVSRRSLEMTVAKETEEELEEEF